MNKAQEFSFDDSGNLVFSIDGEQQTAGGVWFRGEQCNFNPSVENMRSTQAIDRFIVSGWTPAAPFIEPTTPVLAFGSCFAEHITAYLNRRRYNLLGAQSSSAHVVTMGEGMVNTYALRQQFDWVYNGWKPEVPLWFGFRAEQFGYEESKRLETRDLFDQADVFILTVGLSEVWFDEPTGEVFWQSVPRKVFDKERHKFRVTSVAENKNNLLAIYQTIRRQRPGAKLVLTLSPIPLVATFRPLSCITANAVSKSILRAAIDELMREVDDRDHLFYWPSYEIVMDAFESGRWNADRRHVKAEILNVVMAAFERSFCTTGVSDAEYEDIVLAARTVTGKLMDIDEQDRERVLRAHEAELKQRVDALRRELIDRKKDIRALEEVCRQRDAKIQRLEARLQGR